MSILAESMAAQEFGRDAQGNIRWPTPGADADAAAAAAAQARPAPTAAPTAAAPAAPAAPVKPTRLTAEPPPEPPVTGQSAPLDREVKKKTLLGG